MMEVFSALVVFLSLALLVTAGLWYLVVAIAYMVELAVDDWRSAKTGTK